MSMVAFLTEMYARDPDSALEAVRNSPGLALGEGQFQFYPVSLVRGFAYRLAGDETTATESFADAVEVLNSAIERQPEDERLHGALGLAYAGLGLGAEAIAAASRGVELMPMEKEFWRGSHRLEELARVYTLVGENEQALDRLQYLLSVPGELTVETLRLDPMFDGLRDEARFQALVE